MDVPVTTGGSGTPAPAPEVRPMSEAEAVAGIEALLDAEERPQRRPRQQPAAQPEEPAPETAIPESEGQDLPEDAEPEEVIGEEEAASDEPDEESDHQIEPPKSWSSQDKAVFQQLPPEAQAVIARRESERDKAFTQKAQEISEHRKALESTFSEIQNERHSYATNLQQLLAVAMPEAQQFANVDWHRLAQESPADYVRLSAERDALRGRIGTIQQELERVNATAQQDYVRQFATLRASEAKRLVEALPEFGDSEKGKKLASDMREWLQEQGFSNQEIGQVIDHRVIRVAHKAMLADRAARARRTAETRRSDPAPSVQRPGTPQSRESNASRRRTQKMEQLKKTGSDRDALSYLMEIL